MLKKILPGILVVLALLGGIVSAAGQGQKQKENTAVQAAEEWLALVDAGQYQESWQNAANYFKQSVPSPQWRQTIQPVREPLGGVVERKLKSVAYMTQIPGAPDGEYVVVQFNTVFQNKMQSVETVTPMLDSDGVWRVSGYFIK